jgi:hypothetical protein
MANSGLTAVCHLGGELPKGLFLANIYKRFPLAEYERIATKVNIPGG